MKRERPLAVHTADLEVKAEARPSVFAPQGGVHLWYAPLEQLRELLAEHHALLDADEQRRAGRFRHAQDRERFIAGHGLLRVLLGRYLGKAPESIAFGRGEFGKPFLPGYPLHFNVSDTKDAVLAAFADEAIGADVETLHRQTDHAQVAHHYFSAPEVESIHRAADGKRRFLELWTRKEAVLKASGVGLMDDLKNLNVGGRENEMRIAHPDFVRLASPAYHVYTLYPDRDHPVSLAASRPVREIRLFTGRP